MHKINHPQHSEDYLVWREGMGGTVEVFDIAVYSERGKGRGRWLIEELKRQVTVYDDKGNYAGPKLIFAITRWGNTIAMQFYEALGFRIVGRLHNFYRDDDGKWESGVMYGLEM